MLELLLPVDGRWILVVLILAFGGLMRWVRRSPEPRHAGPHAEPRAIYPFTPCLCGHPRRDHAEGEGDCGGVYHDRAEVLPCPCARFHQAQPRRSAA